MAALDFPFEPLNNLAFNTIANASSLSQKDHGGFKGELSTPIGHDTDQRNSNVVCPSGNIPQSPE